MVLRLLFSPIMWRPGWIWRLDLLLRDLLLLPVPLEVELLTLLCLRLLPFMSLVLEPLWDEDRLLFSGASPSCLIRRELRFRVRSRLEPSRRPPMSREEDSRCLVVLLMPLVDRRLLGGVVPSSPSIPRLLVLLRRLLLGSGACEEDRRGLSPRVDEDLIGLSPRVEEDLIGLSPREEDLRASLREGLSPLVEDLKASLRLFLFSSCCWRSDRWLPSWWLPSVASGCRVLDRTFRSDNCLRLLLLLLLTMRLLGDLGASVVVRASPMLLLRRALLRLLLRLLFVECRSEEDIWLGRESSSIVISVWYYDEVTLELSILSDPES